MRMMRERGNKGRNRSGGGQERKAKRGEDEGDERKEKQRMEEMRWR